MRRGVRMLGVFLLPVIFIAVLTNSAAAVIHNISIGNFFFSPTNTTVNPGDTVRWTMVGGIIHTTTSDIGSPKSWNSGDMSVSDTYDVVFTAGDGPGPFPYHCAYHPTMVDTILMAPAPAESTVFIFLMNEAQSNSCAGTGSAATGFGVAVLSSDSTQLSFHIVHNVAGAVDAHVHLGAPCVEGGIVFPFSSPVSPIVQNWALTPTDVANLFAGNLYVNIHSPSSPAGEIRGQIVPTEIRFLFTLDEAQSNGGAGTGSFANGVVIGLLNANGKELSTTVRHNVSSPADAHIHIGAPGVEGGIKFGFSSPVSPITGTWMLGKQDIIDLLSGNLYINVHSTAFPAGEIRGQYVNSDLVFASRLDEEQSGNTGSAATGFSTLVLKTDPYKPMQLSIYCEHNVVNPVDAHIHLGAPGVDGPIQFAFSSPVSPISDTWFLNNNDLTNLLDGNLYINIHSPTFPAGEIRGQYNLMDSISIKFYLDDNQANNCAGTGSTALGTGMVVLKPGGRELTVSLTHNVSSPVDGHIHLGGPCITGGILFGFSSPISPIKDVWYLTSLDIVDLLQKELYANVHSTAFPAEEIRGQIVRPSFICGDANGNGSINILDATFIIAYLFKSGPEPVPLQAANVNNTGGINILDATYLISFLFKNGPDPNCP